MTKHNKKIHIVINGVAVCGAPHHNYSALIREDVTCKVCKRSLDYKKLKSRKQVGIKK